MKVKVDPDLCTGEELCVQVCPQIFEMQGEKAVAKINDVPADLAECCKDAADSCPSAAIIIKE
ncbi:MAG: ferredoxin [candidate division Zixibacteria bacterium]|nr:ferredoxin [candidate division Zixibacteria bacterium]